MRILLRKLSVILLSGTVRDTITVFATYSVTSVLAFFYTVFLARSFSPENLGIFSSITAFILLTADVLDMGITASLSRFYPEIRDREGEKKAAFFLGNTFKFQLLVTVIIVLLVILLSPVLSDLMFKTDNYTTLFMFASLGILGTVMLSYSSASLSAQKKFTKVSRIVITSTLSKLFLVIYLFYVSRFTLENVTASFALAPIVAFTLSLRYVNLTYFRKKFSFRLLRKLISYSAFIGASRILSAISSRFDALMLIPLSSSYEAGIYSAAYKIVFTYILMAGSFSSVIAPRLSGFRNIKESLPYLKKIVAVVFMMLGTVVVMYIAAPVLIPFILGGNYLASIDVFRSLLFPISLFISTIPTVNFLLYVAKKPQISAFNTTCQFIIILTGNLYFIPQFQRFGPVYTLTVAYGFVFLSSLFFTLYYIKNE